MSSTTFKVIAHNIANVNVNPSFFLMELDLSIS